MANPYLKRPTRNLIGLWLTVAVFAFVIGWRLLVIVCGNEPPHWRVIANELGSVPQFKQDLSPNSTGTRLVFCQDTEKGVGIFFCDTDSGKIKQLCEQKEKGRSWQRFSMLSWSPDDKLFAYAIPLNRQINAGEREEQIVVCDGLSGEAVAKISADPHLYELAWLTPHSFVYSTDFTYDLRLIGQNQDGNWVLRQVFQKVSTNKWETLTAISDSSVAWRVEGEIWTLDFASSSIKKIWEVTTNQLVDFTYSKETGEFLINCSDKDGRFLIRFSPSSQWMADVGRIGYQQGSVSSVTWINGGPVTWINGEPRYAYLGYEEKEPVLCIETKLGSKPIRVPWRGSVKNYTLSGDCLFITGNADYKLPGIWEYDIKSGVSRCIVSSSTGGFVYATVTAPLIGAVTNTAGEGRSYCLWQPVHVSTGRKYPLIIAQGLWNGFPYAQVAANEGYFFAIVDKPCVMTLCEELAKNPNVDTNRAYLYASSVETTSTSEFISEKPDLWKGAILFGPGALPDLSDLDKKQLLIIAGRNDDNAVDYLTRFQDQAADTGIPITLSFLNDSEHMPNSVATERVRTRRFAKFLVENQF
jgi:hypothetical protein